MIKSSSLSLIAILLIAILLIVSCGNALTTSTSESTPTTTTPAAEPVEPPQIPHEIASREGLCLTCHEQGDAEIRFPEDHAGWTTDICLSCHEVSIIETTTIPSTTTITTTPTATWGEVAKKVAFGTCTACHGAEGGGDYGPAIIGTTLKSFGTAQRLLSYISTEMPQDAPGGLTGSTYLQILAYMLTESGFVQTEALFDPDNLSNVLLN